MSSAILSPDLLSFLNNPTPAGSGFHFWQMSAANKLALRRVDYQEAFNLLIHAGRIAGRVDPTEIKNTLATAYRDAGEFISESPRLEPWPRRSKWPERNAAAIAQACKTGIGTYDLWERSPHRWLSDDRAYTEEIIDVLFPGNPCLCVGRHAREFRTDYRERLRGQLSECSHIVPSPMFFEGGYTQDGRWSEKNNEAVRHRRFLVTEFDQEDRDTQAAIIWHLRQFGPLVMVVDSMGKSLHAWWFCEGSDETEGGAMRRFMRYAVELGADRAGWVLSQFMRMPDGTREKGENKGKRQNVVYFAPEVIK